MKRWKAGWGALALIACVTASACAATPAVRIVTLTGFNGLPPDSASRSLFIDAFQSEFDAETLLCQKRAGEQWTSSGERVNGFRLVDVAAPEDAWTLEVTIGLPPSVAVARPKPKQSSPTLRPRYTDYRAARGLTIVVSAVKPVLRTPEATEPLRLQVYFPDARRIVVPSPKLPGGAYLYPYADAGRVVARIALELLHHADDSLADDERVDLSPAVRTEDTP